LAIFFTYFKVPVVGIPFHPAVFLLFVAFLFYFSRVGLSLFAITASLFLFVLCVGSAYYSAVLGLEFNVFSWSYKLVPIICLYLSFLVCWYGRLSLAEFRKFIFYILVFFIVVASLQFVPSLKGFFIGLGYISSDRSDVWERYYMLLAPMANPNNSAAVAAALAIFVLLFWDVIKKGSNIFVFFVVCATPILIFFMFLGYARTVSAAFAVAGILWIIVKGGVKGRSLFLVVFSGFFLSIIYFKTREVSYYLTIFSALSDSSFTARFESWRAVISLLNEYPLSWVLGLARVQDAMIQLTGKSVTDSSYIYILGQFGLVVLVGLIALAANLSLRSFRIFVFFTFLAICSITLPIFSDVRLSIIFGGLAGYIYSLTHPPIKKVSYVAK